MWNSKPSRSEQLIYKKRAEEERAAALQTKLKQEFHQKEFAHWQNKGQNIQIQQQTQVRVEAARRAAKAQLNARKYSFNYIGSNFPNCLSRNMLNLRKKSIRCKKPPNRSGRGWLGQCTR